MNDALSGQLCARWTIPAYAQDMLWLTGNDGTAARVEGGKGLFTLAAPAEVLTLRWGGEDGAPLTQIRWQVDSLEWDGAVRLGGFIDAMHITTIAQLPAPIVVLTVGGQPLKPGVRPFSGAGERKRTPYPVPAFGDGIDDEVSEGVTTWIAFEDDAALTLAQDALVSKLRVYMYGRLAEQKTGLHELFALPITLEGMSLFAP
ncbi:MAG: hypothetical protein IPO91_15590 [Chloroflexi bacterium]|nr:hypothetical protein [Chloroflexota bacterium]